MTEATSECWTTASFPGVTAPPTGHDGQEGMGAPGRSSGPGDRGAAAAEDPFPYRLQDLVDLPKLQLMLDAFYRASGIPLALTDLDGTVLTASGWQDACVEFHGSCVRREPRTLASGDGVRRHLLKETSQVVYRCGNGLVDTVTPIIINGCHVANAFTGQLFFGTPDLKAFRRQAIRLGVEPERYLEAIARVPVVTTERLRTHLALVALFAELLAEIGRRRLEGHEALRQAGKMEVLGRLAGGVAHDFNNVLMGIMAYAGLLNAQLPSEPRLQQHVQRILGLSERAAGLTHSLLAFGRPHAYQLQVIDLNVVVQTLHTLLSRIIGEDIDFQVSPAATPLLVLADRGQLDQIFGNLVANARDAMPGGGRLRIRTAAVSFASDSPEAQVMKATDYGEITVEDTGVGMTPTVKQRLFEPFFTTKGVGKGNGLGLSTAYGAVRQLGGSIRVRSEEGRGSTFTVLLPLSRTEPRPAPRRAGLPGRGTETLLVAEDSSDVRRVTRRLLEDYGYRVIEADDGEQAAELFRVHADEVALVLLDVVMPGRSGQQVYEAIKALRPQAKVLFTSGYTEDLLTLRAIGDQPVPFLQKPYTPFDLFWKVREVLDA